MQRTPEYLSTVISVLQHRTFLSDCAGICGYPPPFFYRSHHRVSQSQWADSQIYTAFLILREQPDIVQFFNYLFCHIIKHSVWSDEYIEKIDFSMRIRRNIKQYFIIELFQSLRIKIMITAYNNNIYGIAVCSAVYIVTFRISLS